MNSQIRGYHEMGNWNGTTAAKSTTADVTMKDVIAALERFKLIEQFEKMIALAKKEGCLYVAVGIADALKEAGVVFPDGIELRECKWVAKGMMAAIDFGALDPFIQDGTHWQCRSMPTMSRMPNE